MTTIFAYITALLVFGICDAAWLSLMGQALYRPVLGDILLPGVRLGPAFVFYLLYPAGLVIFAATPALKTGSPMTAIILGGLFGAIAYGTYDLTNFATLRNWTLQITVIDIAYGAAVSALSSAAAQLIARAIVARWFGSSS